MFKVYFTSTVLFCAYHISTLAEKLIAKEKDIHLDAHWNNEPNVKDKTKIAEEKMYQGWCL